MVLFWKGNRNFDQSSQQALPWRIFVYMKKTKVIFWRARLEENDKYIGIPGQIAWISPNNEIRIVAKDSLLVVTDYEVTGDPIRLRVGHRFQ